MRHINGVYTQRHNWLRKTDGSLFKGRYKSVLVDEDDYLLPLTRYIHLNPIETKTPMVSDLAKYPWSSYPAYINKAEKPDWLERDKTYQMLGHSKRFYGYKTYVEQGTDEDLKRYNILSVMGGKDFKTLVEERVKEEETNNTIPLPNNKPSLDGIIEEMSQCGKLSERLLRERIEGKRATNPLKALTMYACRQFGDGSKKAIAGHLCSVTRGVHLI